MAKRIAITARGADLMAMIAAGGAAGLMLTQAEGLDLVNSGFAIVDPTVIENDTAKVTLTETGQASLDGSGDVATKFEIEDNVAMPTSTQRRGRTGGYPFENLNVGQSFHVPAKAGEDAASVAARLQSSVSGARSRFATDSGETETTTVKVYAKGEDGKFLKDEAGKRVIESATETPRPKLTTTRDFKVRAVDSTDPKGAGARVWRTV